MMKMDFLELYNISEAYMEIINPFAANKLVTVGKYLRLSEGKKVIDFGCGYGEPMLIWAKEYGIEGVGIDIRPHVCERAVKKIDARGFSDSLEIVCCKGADYKFTPGGFDVATCIGASFVWGGFPQTLAAMKKAIGKTGRLAIGEPYWIHDTVPPEILAKQPEILRESEILKVIREEGFELEYVVRASDDDWDSYEAGNWYGLIRWLEDNPNHPNRADVLGRLHKSQDEYLGFGRYHFGWAVYIITRLPD